MQRAAGPVLLWKHLERYGPRHADVNPSRKVHCEHQRRYALCPWSATAKVTSAGWAYIATGQPPEEAADVSRNVSVCARVSHNNYY